MNDLQEYLEAKTERTKEEQDLLDRLKSGYFPITAIHRDDLASKGFDTRNISDATMEHLARKMADDYCEQLFWDSMVVIASDRFDIPRLPECPKCGEHWVVPDSVTDTYRCSSCGQKWTNSYTLVEEPEETDRLPDDLGYPSAEAQNSNARYIPEYDYIRIFQKAPEPSSYFEPVCWPESQKYMPDEDSNDSILALNEPINDEKGLEDFGANAVWVPLCNLE